MSKSLLGVKELKQFLLTFPFLRSDAQLGLASAPLPKLFLCNILLDSPGF